MTQIDIDITKLDLPEYYKKNIKKCVLGENKTCVEIIGDGKGKYSIKNKLNHLTGKERKFSTKTVINKQFPLDFSHALRKLHGGQKPPLLCVDIIKAFTKEGDKVLDPFVGVGGTLIGATLSNRKATGIDINKERKDIYIKVCNNDKIKKEEFLIGDSYSILDKLKDRSFDFLLTDVPYRSMDKEEKTRSKKAQKSNLNNFNSEKKQTKEERLETMRKIIHKAMDKVKKGGYAAIFIGDMYANGKYHILHAELANYLEKKDFILKSNIVRYDVSKSLHVYGYPSVHIPSMIHQNILIFKKEI